MNLPSPTEILPTAGWRRHAIAVLLLILAFCSASWGIWNARVEFGDDASPVAAALRARDSGTLPTNAYELFYTLVLRFVAPDVMHAAIVVRSVVSLATVLAMYYLLCGFRSHIRPAAIIMACTVWMVTYLNMPLAQVANLSPFTFALAAVGLGWLLRRPSWWGLGGFLLIMFWATRLRPEYYAPALLIGVWTGSILLFKWFANRPGARIFRQLPIGRWLIAGLLLTFPLLYLFSKTRLAAGMDRYLLFGLGQCYADFYVQEHKDAGFHAMTEYQPLLDKTFGHPTSFFQAILNNPQEAFRYFGLNSLKNLAALPMTMLRTRAEVGPSPLIERLNAVFLLLVLVVGSALLIWRLYTFLRTDSDGRFTAAIPRLFKKYELFFWRVSLVVLFCSAASVAVVMLVGSPRYFISFAPAFYLGVALCFEAILRIPWMRLAQWPLVGLTLLLFCRPLFVQADPNANFEVNALRKITPKLRENPVIAGVYTRPYQAYAFQMRAVSVNASDELSIQGIQNGWYDVLILDGNLRWSRIGLQNAEFFKAFEANPAKFNYKKLEEASAWYCDIYYWLGHQSAIEGAHDREMEKAQAQRTQ